MVVKISYLISSYILKVYITMFEIFLEKKCVAFFQGRHKVFLCDSECDKKHEPEGLKGSLDEVNSHRLI